MSRCALIEWTNRGPRNFYIAARHPSDYSPSRKSKQKNLIGKGPIRLGTLVESHYRFFFKWEKSGCHSLRDTHPGGRSSESYTPLHSFTRLALDKKHHIHKTSIPSFLRPGSVDKGFVPLYYSKQHFDNRHGCLTFFYFFQSYHTGNLVLQLYLSGGNILRGVSGCLLSRSFHSYFLRQCEKNKLRDTSLTI